MSGQEDPYSRLYWKVRADERFEHVFGCDHCWAAYTRLLMDADASYPAPSSIPRTLKPHALAHLTESGIIVIQPHGCFVVHGLEAEREKRSAEGRENALRGWARRRGGTPPATQRPPIQPVKGPPMLYETRRDETRQDEGNAPAPVFGVVEYVEKLAKRPFGHTPGSKVWETLEADVAAFGKMRVIMAMEALGVEHPDAGQLVFGASRVLHPIKAPSTEVVESRVRQSADAARQRAEAERRQRLLDEDKRKKEIE